MPQSTIRAIFCNYTDAAGALETLISQGFSPKDVSVIGQDSDAFRHATSVLQSKHVDRLIIVLGSSGFIVGAFAGFAGLPSLTNTFTPMSPAFMSVIMGSFSGALLGLITGSYIGGILHLDNRPATRSSIRMGKVTGGVMAVIVQAKDAGKLALAKRAVLGNSASNLCIKL